MRTVVLPEELLERSEQEARERWLDVRNLAVLRRLPWGFGVLALIALIQAIESRAIAAIAVAAADAVAVVALAWLVRRVLPASRVRPLLIAAVPVQLAVMLAVSGLDTIGWAFAFVWLLPLLRLRGSELALLGGALWLLGSGWHLAGALLAGHAIAPSALIGLTVVTALAGGLALALTARAARAFRAAWAVDSVRHAERVRMKQELEAARDIQLSMLPAGVPALPWLDVAAVSLPASEVGGDWYDYFPLGDGRLVVAVADVAGHGLPSGMLLAGVRSCLYLLRAELDQGELVLARLDAMVRATAVRRAFVTLQLVLLDPARRLLTVSAAGHPPALLRCGGRVREVGPSCLPLGGLPGARFTSEQAALGDDSVLLLCTDGIAETADASGQAYGYDRLQAVLAGAPAGVSAAALREAVLTDLWTFKGVAPQVDDVTLVALRLRS